MSDQVWVVRAGREARFVDDFLQGSYVAISFREFAADDLRLAGEDSLRGRATTATERSYAGQLIAFAFRVEVGDLVVVPRLSGSNRDYLVARVTGPYEHVEESPMEKGSGNHRRTVEWLGGFAKKDLSASGSGSLGAISTIFRPTAAEAELRTLMTALVPFGDGLPTSRFPTAPRQLPQAPNASVATTRTVTPPQIPAQLEVEIDELGRARLSSAHPALLMEQTSRHIEPSREWGGVPGIYVLTGTELQHSATRTGLERTLTTTLIVRPWAYVGLSEDFLSRIGSHRQSKPEWRRVLLVRSGGQPFTSDDIKYLEQKVHATLIDTGEVVLGQSTPRGNLSARPRNTVMLDACASTVVAVLRLTGTLI